MRSGSGVIKFTEFCDATITKICIILKIVRITAKVGNVSGL